MTTSARVLGLLIVAVTAMPVLANAQEPGAAPPPPPPAPKDGTDISGLGLGAALALRWSTGPDVVTDASVDANGFVRVNTRANTMPGIMLEGHYYLRPRPNSNFGVGPFVAVAPGSNEIINAVGAGLLFGWKLKNDPNDHKGFGLGVGYAAEAAAKQLGVEFVENQAAPKGPDGKPLPIRLQTADKGAFLFIASFTF